MCGGHKAAQTGYRLSGKYCQAAARFLFFRDTASPHMLDDQRLLFGEKAGTR